jgi:hypothetical protein
LLFSISFPSPTPSNWSKNILKTFLALPNRLSQCFYKWPLTSFMIIIWKIIIWTLMLLMSLDLFFDTWAVLDVISSALSALWHLMLPKNENENLIQCHNILGVLTCHLKALVDH